jgi:tellurite resistance protein TehA-like permease
LPYNTRFHLTLNLQEFYYGVVLCRDGFVDNPEDAAWSLTFDYAGTGALSVLLFIFPYGQGSLTLTVLSLMLYGFNILLAILFTVISVLRFALYPELWNKVLRHPVQNVYLACYPMAVSTLVNASVVVLSDKLEFGGSSFVYFLWGLWWFDAVLSTACCFVGFHHM